MRAEGRAEHDEASFDSPKLHLLALLCPSMRKRKTPGNPQARLRRSHWEGEELKKTNRPPQAKQDAAKDKKKKNQ